MLTKEDLQQIREMILLGNEILLSSVKKEMTKLLTREEFLELKYDVSTLKDDYGGLKTNFDNFTALVQESLKVHEREISAVKIKLGI